MNLLKRWLGPLLLLLLIGGVGTGIYVSRQDKVAQSQKAAVPATPTKPIAVMRGLVGSEKLPLLADPRVVALLRKQGLELKLEKAGSREIAARPSVQGYDFAFPAGTPAALKLMQQAGTSKSYTPFYSPLVIASWKGIADLLVANGLARQEGDHYAISDTRGLVQLIADGKRWKDLPKNTVLPINRSVLIGTTDVRKSNSAAMFLSIVSYVLNDENVVQGEADIAKLMPKIAPMFLKQGFQEASSAGPFEDYVTIGMGKAPLVVIYESQFIEYELKQPAAHADMVLLYPQPTVFTKHTLVPLTPNGEKLGEFLSNDVEFLHIAAEYGYRIKDVGYTRDLWKKRGINIPESLLDVINPPSYEVLEALITSLEQRMACAQGKGC